MSGTGGTISPTDSTIASGGKYTVSCKSGFTISGTAEMICTAGSLSTTPTCLAGRSYVLLSKVPDAHIISAVRGYVEVNK